MTIHIHCQKCRIQSATWATSACVLCFALHCNRFAHTHTCILSSVSDNHSCDSMWFINDKQIHSFLFFVFSLSLLLSLSGSARDAANSISRIAALLWRTHLKWFIFISRPNAIRVNEIWIRDGQKRIFERNDLYLAGGVAIEFSFAPFGWIIIIIIK